MTKKKKKPHEKVFGLMDFQGNTKKTTGCKFSWARLASNEKT